MSWEEYQKRRVLRSQLEQDSFRIANPLEYAVLKFILGKENDTYPTQHSRMKAHLAIGYQTIA